MEDKLIGILKEEGYPPFMIEKTIEKIHNLSFSVNEVFSKWLEDGRIPKLTIEGYSYSMLLNEYGMKPIGAFLTLDWLVKKPEEAKTALEKGIV